MNIFITLDYELFFGAHTGSVQESIIKPTNHLTELLDPYNISATFFVDSGYLLALERQKKQYPQLEDDYTVIKNQLKELVAKGHSIELHIHPHWEDSFFDGKKWHMNTKRYRLDCFKQEEVTNIFDRYTNVLTKITNKKPIAYRAGGWSAQPFSNLKPGFESNNLRIDSSVYPQGFYSSSLQNFDFRAIDPYVTQYSFDENLTKQEENGKFLEVPISSIKVTPLFFWKFASKKLIKNKEHKPFGDGSAIPLSTRQKLKLLTISSYSVVSIDGFKSTLIQKAFTNYTQRAKTHKHFVLIGHPKAFTPYSLKKLKEFIESTKDHHNFVTYEIV
ncbi:hypothetical protein GCM10009117_19140 [Gangjinia marincola]|uniref:NodB homology domain-containing protein n=1 Tax=Gangjinia marincola TaxID=578463 RepID=A0ABN1MHU8_9FLAO